MDNKDEKTFKDIFSSSNDELEPATKTFSDILISSNEEENKETVSQVTFDSLFDKLPFEEKTSNEIALETDVSNQYNQKDEFQIEQNSIISSIFDNKEDISLENNIPFFEDSKNTQPVSKTNVEPNINSEPQEKKVVKDDNPFFSTDEDIINNQNMENKIGTNIQDDKFEFSNNSFIKNEVNENISSEIPNPFLEEDKISVANPFFEDKIQNTEKEFNSETIPSNDDIKVSENNTNIAKENIISNIPNPFLEEDKISVANPFFEDKIQNTEKEFNSETIPSNDEIKKSENNTNITKENINNKSSSPFFVEEKKSEENPFSQNKINLIENKVPHDTNTTINTTDTKHYSVKVVKKKEPLIKVILGVLSYALFIWLLLIGVTLLVYVLDIKIRAAKGDYSSPTFNAYVVLTGSMLPEIEVFDVVVTKKVEASKLNEGDVITFSSADERFLGTIITHRIIKKNPPTTTEGYTFQTQGDNNNVADSALVPENNIYGKVILKIPKLGYLQEFLASDGGWIIVILIPCLTVISYDIVKIIKGLKRKKYKNIKVQK